MKARPDLGFALVLYAVFATAIAIMLGYASLTSPEAKTVTRIVAVKLPRFPVLDSKQEIRTGIFIVCTAFSNRPTFDVTAPVTDSALGFRVVSDCRTVKG